MASVLGWWGPVVLYMGLIFWSSSRLRPEAFSATPDYWLHGAAYFALSALSIRALSRGLARPGRPLALAGGVAIATVYGVSDEWHQSFVPGREASVVDVLFDFAGALGAALSIGLFWKFRGAQSVY